MREMEPNTHRVVLCDFLFTAWSTLKSSKYLECLQLTQSNTMMVMIGSDSVSKDIAHQSRQREGGVDWRVTSAFFGAYLKS